MVAHSKPYGVLRPPRPRAAGLRRGSISKEHHYSNVRYSVGVERGGKVFNQSNQPGNTVRPRLANATESQQPNPSDNTAPGRTPPTQFRTAFPQNRGSCRLCRWLHNPTRGPKATAGPSATLRRNPAGARWAPRQGLSCPSCKKRAKLNKTVLRCLARPMTMSSDRGARRAA